MMEGYGTRLEPPEREVMEALLEGAKERVERHEKREQELEECLAPDVDRETEKRLKKELWKLQKCTLPEARGKYEERKQELKAMRETGDDG